MTPSDRVEDLPPEWAADATGEVLAHVRRHGVEIPWNEAYEHVLIEAGLGPLAFVNEDGTTEPIRNNLPRLHPDFSETVAASHLHWLGRRFLPTRPDSEVPVGVSTHTLVEAHVRLSVLLLARLDNPGSDIDRRALAGLVTMFVNLLGTNQLMDLDEGQSDEKLEGSDYLILRARDVAATIGFLEAGEGLITGATPAAALQADLPTEAIRSPDAHRTCVLALRWWLGTV